MLSPPQTPVSPDLVSSTFAPLPSKTLDQMLEPALQSPATKNIRILITGGNGFIGSHLAHTLYQEGYFVRIIDVAESNKFGFAVADEVILGNLCDPDDCARAVHETHVVFHLAARMGGMGVINSENDQQIYTENHLMTSNILTACTSSSSSVSIFFYASSACVYPDSLQQFDHQDVSLRESDVDLHPVSPQGLYGLEKYASEHLVLAHGHHPKHPLSVRIARFHNVYGPHGSFMDGREKAPAALLRKAHALSLRARDGKALEMEIWGSGEQRRSFLYIDDAIDALLRLMRSQVVKPINIGSTRSITIKALAEIALRTAELTPESIHFVYDLAKETGVASRNSNNDFIKAALDWTPSVTLEEGMKKTGSWIRESLQALAPRQSDSFLSDMQRSRLTSLADEVIRFAILLPVTSRGTASPEDCLLSLQVFVRSLLRTTYRDTHSWGGTRYSFKIYVALDHDDHFLLGETPSTNKVREALIRAGITADSVVSLIVRHPRGNVCALWRDCAFAAWNDGCDYYVLLGDDVELMDEGWMRDVHDTFVDASKARGLPHGIGCVAFTDVSFPGMPTFPVIHRTHMNIFDGQVIPPIFINQDGDPFLFQLYRRFGASEMIPARIRNGIGGETAARYHKQSAEDWTFETLDSAANAVEAWLASQGYPDRRLLTFDVIVPSYRVDLRLLRPILSLQSTSTASTGFVIIIDNALAAGVPALLAEFSHRPDVRIRINSENRGASASRNRGLTESAAEWVLFLDDDVQPSPDILINLERAIRNNPLAAGV